MPRLLALVALFTLVASDHSSVRAQSVPSSSAARPAVEEIVASASKQVTVYLDTFRNLISQETKTLERFSKDGDLKRSRRIISTFIVYQSSRNENNIAEYRNVISVDGRPAGNPDERARDFFERLLKSQDAASELRRIENESSRYDDDLSVSGMTLFQGVALFEHIRPVMTFRLRGTEIVDGSESFVVEYEQTKPSPYITTDERQIPADGKTPVIYDIDLDFRDGGANGRLRGTLWIDAGSYQIRRERREFSVQPERSARRMPVAENVFEYQNSDFGILTPRRISVTAFRLNAKGELSAKENRVVLEYGKFTRPDVEVGSPEIRNPGY